MKFFVSVSSVVTSRFANITQSSNIKHFNKLPFKERDIIPNGLIKDFEKSDVVIINGTWGNDLRKELYLKRDANTGEFILNAPEYRHRDGSISYKIRSAILDAINSEIRKRAIELKKPIVVFESCTISRSEKNYISDYNIKSHSRLSLDSWIYGNGKWLEERDFLNQPVVNSKNLYDHTWKMNEQGSIYIFTGSEIDPTSTTKVYDFLQSTIKTIRTCTERKIRIKLHPISFLKRDYENFVNEYPNVELIDQKIPLKNLYSDMYCAVIDNSTSIFELIDAGIPTYCSNVNFGRGLLNTNIETVNNPYLASKEEVLRWTNQMCCTEIPAANFSKKETIKQIERLIERHYSGV